MSFGLGFWATAGGSAGGVNFISFMTAAGGANGLSIVKDSADNLYVSGASGSPSDIQLVKYSSAGVVQWQRKLASGTAESGTSIGVDSSNNIYVGATIQRSGNFSAFYVAKYNSSGTLQWQRFLDGTRYDDFSKLAVSASGVSYLVGGSDTPNSGSRSNPLIARYNTSGTIQYQAYANNADPGGYGLGAAVDTSDNYYFTGYAIVGGIPRFQTYKINSSNTVQWQARLDSSGDAIGYACATDSSLNVFVVGSSGSYSVEDAQIIKYNSSGVVQWQRTLSTASQESFSDVHVDSAGDIYAIGFVKISGVNHGLLAKYNTSGTLQWQRTFSNLSLSKITSDSSNNLYLSATNGANQVFVRVPNNGSATGTYSISGVSVTYAVATMTDASSSYTTGTYSVGLSGTSLTDGAGALTDSATTLTQTIVNF